MAPLERTMRAVILRDLSRKTKLATTLKKPMTMARIPEATSRRQKGRVSDFWLVASLFMLPSMLSPTTIIAQPKVTKP